MTTGISGIINQAAGYVREATTYVVNSAKTAYVTFKTAVSPTDGPIKGAELEKTGVSTTEDNAVRVIDKTDDTIQTIQNDAELDAYITKYLSKYITENTNVASASYNAAMALGGFEEAYEKTYEKTAVA